MRFGLAGVEEGGIGKAHIGKAQDRVAHRRNHTCISISIHTVDASGAARRSPDWKKQ
ncbi:MAG: hypothetical protein Fur0046_27630 [Cyanobacteria bacterium J069]